MRALCIVVTGHSMNKNGHEAPSGSARLFIPATSDICNYGC